MAPVVRLRRHAEHAAPASAFRGTCWRGVLGVRRVRNANRVYPELRRNFSDSTSEFVARGGYNKPSASAPGRRPPGTLLGKDPAPSPTGCSRDRPCCCHNPVRTGFVEDAAMETTKQVSVFLENKPGRLANVLRALERQKINITGMTVMDSHEHSVLRLVTNDEAKTMAVLKEMGTNYTL